MISLQQLDNIIENIFDDTLVRTLDTVYELSNNEEFYKLVFSFHNITLDDTIILHTKFIFKTNLEKTHLIEDSFIYLYDINCQYHKVNFGNELDLKEQILDILNTNDFGKDIRKLSEFLESPSMLINSYLQSEGVETIGI